MGSGITGTGEYLIRSAAVEQWKAEVRERWEKHPRLILGGFGVAAAILLVAGVAAALEGGTEGQDRSDGEPRALLGSARGGEELKSRPAPKPHSQTKAKEKAPPAEPQGGSGPPTLSDVNSTADQYELARQIGYELCADPIYPDRAAADPVGYAEEEFGGSGEFDSAREAGCLEALGQ